MKYEWIDEYLLSLTGVSKDYKVEWGWDRYLIRDKMIAALCQNKEKRDILTVKCEPSLGEQLRTKYPDINEGYYMNKTHWNSVCLDGDVPKEVLIEMMTQSYTLILNGFSKKAQKEISWRE